MVRKYLREDALRPRKRPVRRVLPVSVTLPRQVGLRCCSDAAPFPASLLRFLIGILLRRTRSFFLVYLFVRSFTYIGADSGYLCRSWGHKLAPRYLSCCSESPGFGSQKRGVSLVSFRSFHSDLFFFILALLYLKMLQALLAYSRTSPGTRHTPERSGFLLETRASVLPACCSGRSLLLGLLGCATLYLFASPPPPPLPSLPLPPLLPFAVQPHGASSVCSSSSLSLSPPQGLCSALYPECPALWFFPRLGPSSRS